MHQPDEQSGRPRNGTKRARIGKASGSTDCSFGPDAVIYMYVRAGSRATDSADSHVQAPKPQAEAI